MYFFSQYYFIIIYHLQPFTTSVLQNVAAPEWKTSYTCVIFAHYGTSTEHNYQPVTSHAVLWAD